MGFRFRRSIKILPGVRWNLSRRGSSLSVGGRGFTTNLSRRGVRQTVGLPGSRLSYSHLSSARHPHSTVAPVPREISPIRRMPVPSAEDLAHFHLAPAPYPAELVKKRRLLATSGVTSMVGGYVVAASAPSLAIVGIAAVVLGLVLMIAFASVQSATAWRARDDGRIAAEWRAAQEGEAAAAKAKTAAFAATVDGILNSFGRNSETELDQVDAIIGNADADPILVALVRHEVALRRQVNAFMATRTVDGFPMIQCDLLADDKPCFFLAGVTIDGRGLHGAGNLYLLGERVLFLADPVDRHEWDIADVERWRWQTRPRLCRCTRARLQSGLSLRMARKRSAPV